MTRPTSRRSLFGGAAALTLGVTLPAVAATAANPDADLIRTCAEHIANHKAYNTDGGYLDVEDDPLWAHYRRTHDLIDAAEPQTLAGIQAIARAAKAEGSHSADGEVPDDGTAIAWSWKLVGAVLRLNGGVA
jgi:hypothetical protein